jgi:hypothetical protein
MLLPDHLSLPLRRHATFEGSGSIRGVVMDGDHDKPVPDATVVLLSLRMMGGVQRETPSDSVMTNPKGEFVFERLPAGRYFVEAYHGPGMLVPWHDPDAPVPMIQLEEGAGVAGVMCKVYGGHRLLVRLNGSDLPEPDTRSGRMQMGGVTHEIWIRRESLRVEGGLLRMGGGMGTGNVRMSGHEIDFRGIFGPSVRLSFSFGRYWARGANGERLDSLELELPRDQYEVELELNLEPPPFLRGQITRTGEGVRGPGVVTWRPSRHGMFIGAGQSVPTSVVSDEGAFSIEIPGRHDGTLEFVLENEEPIHYGVLPFRQSFPETLEVTVPEPGRLRVQVLGEEDEPAAGATVWATVEDSGRTRSGSDPIPRITFLPHQPAAPENVDPARGGNPFEGSLHRRYEAIADAEGIATFPRMSAGSVTVRAFGAPGSRLAPSADVKATVAFGRESEATVKLEGFKPLAGVVEDEEGNPIVGAQVFLGQAETVRGRPVEVVPETRTDEQGRFRFETVGPRDTQQLNVSLPGEGVRRGLGRATPGDENVRLKVGTVAWTAPGSVRLRVRDEITGQPIPHATLLDWQGKPLTNFSRSSDGHLEIPGAQMNPPLHGYLVTAVGYARSPVPFVSGHPSSSTVSLAPSASLRGRVIDEASGTPIEGADVEYVVSSNFGSSEVPPSPFRVKTDSSGEFVLADVPVWVRSERVSRNAAESRHLRIEAGAEYAPRYLAINPDAYGLTDLGDLSMNAGLEVMVSVMREGEPVVGERIVVATEPVQTMVMGLLKLTREGLTDEEGRVPFTKVPPGRTTVSLPARNLTRTLMPYESRFPIEIQLGRGAVQIVPTMEMGNDRISLHGNGPDRLVLRGSLPGLSNPWEPAPIERGSSLPLGWWRFNVSAGNSNAGRLRVDAELTDDAPELKLPISFGAATVKVRVEAEEGVRVSNLRVTMERVGEASASVRVRHEASTNREGEATLHRIPSGEYRVAVIPQGSVDRWFTATVVVGDTDMEQSVTATRAEEGGTITVRAFCAETGAPLENFAARVAIAPENWPVAPGTKDEDGSIVFVNVPPERLRVSASPMYHLGQEVELALSSEEHREVILRLEPAGRLQLAIEDVPSEDAQRMVPFAMDTGLELVRQESPEKLVDFWMIHPRHAPMNPNRAYAQGDYLVRFLNEGRLVEEREIEIKVGQTLVLPVHWAEKRLGVASSRQ